MCLLMAKHILSQTRINEILIFLRMKIYFISLAKELFAMMIKHQLQTLFKKAGCI